MDESKTFDFKEQLKVGAKGEDLFLALYPKAEKTDGIKHDFILNGKTIELKTDSYDMETTKNFFMEHISDIKGLKDSDGKLGRENGVKMGGPWRALEDGVDYFVYLFQKQKKCFWFKPKPLVEFLNEHIKTLGYKVIRNKGWSSRGYAVEREKVAHLYLDIK